MLDSKCDLVEYLILVGDDDDFKDEYQKRLNEDLSQNLVSVECVRQLKLKKIFYSK